MRKLSSRKVQFGNLYWTVNSVNQEELPENCVGQCSPPMEATINILEQGGMEDIDTLLHEIIHAMDFAHSIKLTENQTDKLAYMFSMFLRDNAWIHKYVDQKVKEEYYNA
jgi:hypothetical protein